MLAAKEREVPRSRLVRFGRRGGVLQTGGPVRLPLSDGSVDRVIATYVIDLLSSAQIRAFCRRTDVAGV